MPNIASIFKSEIVRLARKEVRQELASLKKASAAIRSEMAALKKEVRSLRVELKRAPRTKPAAADPQVASKFRFRPATMKTHRKKLGLSAHDYGLLVDASALSVYKWEDAKTKPRDSALPRIAAVIAMGKREALRRLSELKTD